MDEILKFYLNLNYTKNIEEEIVRGLKILNSPWLEVKKKYYFRVVKN